ncbi:MAG TPA: hypothetical protein ENK53_06380 [Thiotrichales bacterium]|nr:hypothetical protein [Thiotrichales bacterium]
MRKTLAWNDDKKNARDDDERPFSRNDEKKSSPGMTVKKDRSFEMTGGKITRWMDGHGNTRKTRKGRHSPNLATWAFLQPFVRNR